MENISWSAKRLLARFFCIMLNYNLDGVLNYVLVIGFEFIWKEFIFLSCFRVVSCMYVDRVISCFKKGFLFHG